jgi:DNA segregation ATPase FtsK/SpoIIIE, S-DNA-T family
MSQNDSSYLADTPLASKLGPQLALFQNEESGIAEKFRPYAWPSGDFLAWTHEQLISRASASANSDGNAGTAAAKLATRE